MADDVGRPERQPQVLEEDFGKGFGGGPQHGFRAVLLLYAGELLRGIVEGFVPRRLAPFALAARARADQRLLQTRGVVTVEHAGVAARAQHGAGIPIPRIWVVFAEE